MFNQQFNEIANFTSLILQFALVLIVARLEGFEPPAYGLEVRCSIQLSYRRFSVFLPHVPEGVHRHWRPSGPITAEKSSKVYPTRGQENEERGKAKKADGQSENQGRAEACA